MYILGYLNTLVSKTKNSSWNLDLVEEGMKKKAIHII